MQVHALCVTPSRSCKDRLPERWGLQDGAGELDNKMDEWIEQFSQQTSEELQQQQQQRRAMSAQAGLPTSQDYIMAEDNPFLEVCPECQLARRDFLWCF